ncbi:MAG TPA: HK97 family phage prohead protease [Ilumatobacteraceae bacterium]|nr:HK97 family phage prohead protease [Ilumatobacteraceae bacterium]
MNTRAIWANVLADVQYNRAQANVAGVEHDPSWDEWEDDALDALGLESRHSSHNQKDHAGKGGAGDDFGKAFVSLFASDAFGTAPRGEKKKALKKEMKKQAKKQAKRDRRLGVTLSKKELQAFAGIEWRHGQHPLGVDTPEGLRRDDRVRLGRSGRASTERRGGGSRHDQLRGGDDVSTRAGNTGVQYRSYALADFEFRDDGPTGFTFDGIASVVDTPYAVRDQYGEFQETIKAGAFNKTLRDSKADVALFVNHDQRGVPLATRGAGTLQLSADPDLHVTANLDPTRPDAQVIRSAISRGEMRQMSIGFSVPKARDAWSDDFSERTISEVALVETSIVWKGASPTTTANIRSLLDVVIDDDDLDEDELRRALLTRGFVLEPTSKPAFVVRPELVQLFAKRPH